MVDTGGVLCERFPVLFVMLAQPTKALLPSRRKPTRLQRPYSRLGTGYGNFMKRASKVGLVQLRAEKHVARHRGKLLVSGDVAVKKHDMETRVITDVITNQLMDEDALPRHHVAHIPRFRSY